MTAANNRGNRLGIIGLGLIGGSIALAAGRAGWHISAYDRHSDTTAAALQGEHIHHAAADIAALGDSDIIVIAVPMCAYDEVLAQIAPLLQSHTVITDSGSSKRTALAAASRMLGKHAPRFVAGHPVAGKEQSGWQAASADLFRGALTILCPDSATDPQALAAVQTLWQQLGARLEQMPADQHDNRLAAVSHLPHILAYTLVNAISRQDNNGDLLQLAAGGFRDFTRIASSEPEMWRDICLTNGENILEQLDKYQQQLADLSDFIRQQDSDSLYQQFAAARDLRQKWLNTLEQ